MKNCRAIALALILLPALSIAQSLTTFTNKKSGRAIFFKPQANTQSQAVFTAAGVSPQGSSTKTPSPSPTASGTPDPLKTTSSLISQSGLATGATTLEPERIERDRLGMTHVRYSQKYRGIRVYGADAMAHLDKDGAPSSLGANISESLRTRSVASITSTKAVSLAKSYWKNEYGTKYAPVLGGVQQYVYDTSIIKNIPTAQATRELVYAVRLLSDAPGRSWIYFVSAESGALVSKEELEYGIDRKIADCSYDEGVSGCAVYRDNLTDPFGNYMYGRREDSPPNGPNPRYLPAISTDNDDAYSILGQIHSYLATNLGLDGANRQGGLGAGPTVTGSQPLTTTKVQTYSGYLPSWQGTCPIATFVHSGAVLICEGGAVPDIIGHEYAHGIQFFSHWESGAPVGMVYEGETSAVMENHSDVFGEAIESVVNGVTDWINGGSGGILSKRNLANPILTRGVYNSVTPDRTYDPGFYCGISETSVRYGNMQVLSKAFYLVSEGGWFNGCSISSGIGIDKAIKIWTRAVTSYYSRVETFNGAAYKLQQSCADLFGGESSIECSSLRIALQSVQLDQAGRCSGQIEALPACSDAVI